MESIVHLIEGDCEAYSQKGTQTKVIVSDDCISSIERKHIRGTGFRVIAGGCQGFAYTTDENRIKEAAKLASELATVSSEVKQVPAPQKYSKVGGLLDPRLQDMDTATIEEIATDMLRGVTEKGGHILYGSVEVTKFFHEIVTSYGVHGSFYETSCYAGIDVKVDGFFGTETLYTRNSSFDPYALGQRATELALASKNPQKIKGGIMPVILRPPAASKFFEHAVVPLFLADNLDNKMSVFGKIGEKVTSEITITDDGTLEGGIGSRSFDGEGVPCKKTVIVEKGILQSFLFDTTAAFQYGAESTGNAVRSSFRVPPIMYITNLAITSGRSTDELIETIRNGIVVNDIVGSFSFDYSTGKFGFEAKNVFSIDRGEIKHAAADVTIVGRIGDILQTVEPGNDVKQEGLLFVVLFEK